MDNRSALASRLTTTIDRLPETGVAQLLALGDDALLALLLLGQEQPTTELTPPTAPVPELAAQESICIPFEIAGQQFEAVGFLRKGEASCLGEKATRRCDNGNLVREEADWQLLNEHRAQLPAELRPYWLMTARPYPVDSRAVSRVVSDLYFDGNEWCGHWFDLDDRWYQRNLVVRRRVS